jgi:rubredoxin
LDARETHAYENVVSFDFLGTFRCRACGHVFRAMPGSDRDAICPKRTCRSLYAEWLDYDRFAKETQSELR